MLSCVFFGSSTQSSVPWGCCPCGRPRFTSSSRSLEPSHSAPIAFDRIEPTSCIFAGAAGRLDHGPDPGHVPYDLKDNIPDLINSASANLFLGTGRKRLRIARITAPCLESLKRGSQSAIGIPLR